MKKFPLVLILLFLVAACHQKHKEVNDEPDTIATETDEVVDTTRIEPQDEEPSSTVQADDQFDIEETMNLRKLARKQRAIYSPAMLVGEWLNGTLYELYNSDGSGLCWDSSDDVGRDEAQKFSWSLDSNMLTVIHHMEMGGIVPRRYVVTFVDEKNLVYRDVYGRNYIRERQSSGVATDVVYP